MKKRTRKITKHLGQQYSLFFTNKKFLWSFIVSILAFIVGMTASLYAIVYANESISNPVTDIILNNIPVFDVDGIFIYGPVVFFVLISAYLLYHPIRIPFTLKSVGLFLVVRSIFISLTHVAPFPVHTQIVLSGTGMFKVFMTSNDLFFSSHTGLPFLMALIFWNDKIVRYFSLAASFIFGAVVLMAHLHYSIDVFAAFFITYGIYVIACNVFAPDQLAFNRAKADR